MAKLNTKGTKTAPQRSPIRTVARDTTTYEGAPAYSRDAKSDLFLLGTTQFYGEDTFYEKGDERAARLKDLVRQVAVEDPAWLLKFIPWLRREGNIRTAAVVAAVEAARALAKPNQVGTNLGAARQVIRDTLYRPDEPAEALAYYLSTYGRKMPNPVRRGIADAASIMYGERSFIKYDSDRNAVRMADVIELTHPTPKLEGQSELFRYILDSRRRPTPLPESLKVLARREALNEVADVQDRLDPELLKGAGITWEQASSWGKFTPQTWAALIPSMGYMALLRNLRNFQEAGLPVEVMNQVVARLRDPEQVAKSRQLPYRFLSAYLEATNPAWAPALEEALSHATKNIPSLPGRTLVLVDTSASMSTVGYSAKSKITPVMAGALFAVALATKGESVDLYGFADGQFAHPIGKGGSVLREVERFIHRTGEVGHGTQISEAVKATYKGHDRVVIVTDMQTFNSYLGDPGKQVPPTVPMYAFNMAGYKPTMMELGQYRHEMGGLTDRTFSVIPMIEAGQQAKWPWED